MKIQGTVNKYPQQIAVGAEILVNLGYAVCTQPKKRELDTAKFVKVVQIEKIMLHEKYPARTLVLEDGTEVIVFTNRKVVVKE